MGGGRDTKTADTARRFRPADYNRDVGEMPSKSPASRLHHYLSQLQAILGSWVLRGELRVFVEEAGSAEETRWNTREMMQSPPRPGPNTELPRL